MIRGQRLRGRGRYWTREKIDPRVRTRGFEEAWTP
jgi:hypothetical protein